MNFEIIPGKGIAAAGGLILLGSTKDKVTALLGDPQISGNSFYYYENELRFDFGADGWLEFIEFLGGVDGKIKPQIYGEDAFGALHDIVYGILAEKNGKEIVNMEDGHCYVFPRIGVRVYRELTPKELLEAVKEMEAEGIPFENYIDYEADKRRALHWDTIGIEKV